MKKFFLVFVAIFLLFSEAFAGEKSLLIFAGSVVKEPLEEIAQNFYKKTGVKVNISFGGSGFVLSQMNLAKKGDIYFPGSSDFMEKAKESGVVFPETEKIVLYLVPVIAVEKGNPKNIKGLKCLTRQGIKVVIADPREVCVGLYAVEIIEKNFNEEEKKLFRKNLINYTESCEKTATAISLKTADVAIGWRIFHYWDPKRIDIIPLDKKEIERIGYVPIAVSKFTKDYSLAKRFIDYVLSHEGKAVFRKYNYFVEVEDAIKFIGSKKPVGGSYKLPESWKAK